MAETRLNSVPSHIVVSKAYAEGEKLLKNIESVVDKLRKTDRLSRLLTCDGYVE
ncbi:MAG TPA: hypothetical protein VJ001_11790 [Rhodocyclaceae bacterium]|nr:hypothetical protein [Rhodocyclaceae bacterium]